MNGMSQGSAQDVEIALDILNRKGLYEGYWELLKPLE